MTDEEAVKRGLRKRQPVLAQNLSQLSQRDVGLGPKQGQDRGAAGLDLVAMTIAAERPWSDMAGPFLQVAPPTDARRAHPEPFGCLSMASAGRKCRQNAFAKIDGQGFRHLCRLQRGRESESERT
jgi:hypothetical protein